MAQAFNVSEPEREGKIIIFGKHLQVTPSLKEYLISRIKKIEELTPPVVGVHVYLSIEKRQHRVEIVYQFSHFKIVITHATAEQAKMDDMYRAIDLACDKLKGKIRKWKTRIQDHHKKKLYEQEERLVQVLKKDDLEEINDLIEEESLKQIEKRISSEKVLKKKKIPMLTVQEAIMRMDLSCDNFLVYRNQEEGKLRVIYLRRDRTFGILEIE